MHNESQEIDGFKARWIRVSADMLEHDAFAGEPYSKHAAWLWLIANAAWKPRRFKAPSVNAMIELERGQVLAARHYLADKWQWSEKKVRNFLAFLLSQKMIEMGQSKGRFANIVTICNYDKYQTANNEKGQLNGQMRASSGPVEGQTLTKNTNITNSEDTPLPPTGAKRVRGSRLPEDWELPEDWRQWALVNCPSASLEMVNCEALKFANHWQSKPGSSACKLDWRKTFQNWCLTAFSRAPLRPTGGYQSAASATPNWQDERRRKTQIIMALARGETIANG